MSRIGKLPVPVPGTVNVSLANGIFTAKGPKGELAVAVPADMKVEIGEGEINVKRPSDSKEHKSLHGLARSLVNYLADFFAADAFPLQRRQALAHWKHFVERYPDAPEVPELAPRMERAQARWSRSQRDRALRVSSPLHHEAHGGVEPAVYTHDSTYSLAPRFLNSRDLSCIPRSSASPSATPLDRAYSRTCCVISIEQNFGPHMEQNSAVLK